MKYFFSTSVWVRFTDEKDAQLERLGLGEDRSKLETDKITLDLCQVIYFRPATMQDDNDSTYVRLKGKEDLILFIQYPDFNKAMKEMADFFK